MRFERECHALGAVANHPNIVGVHQGGFTEDGRAYLVMELCPDGSLHDRLRRDGPLPAEEVIEVGIKIGRALAVAHEAGVIHRDVKPANILVTAYGEPALADFGIARVEGGQHTATGMVTASFSHAAPEVLHGQAPGATSDVYSLGSTLFELFVGHAPHYRGAEESAWAVMNRIATEPIPDPASLGMPEPLATVVRTATAADPGQRYQQVAALVEALSAPIGSRPDGAAETDGAHGIDVGAATVVAATPAPSGPRPAGPAPTSPLPTMPTPAGGPTAEAPTRLAGTGSGSRRGRLGLFALVAVLTLGAAGGGWYLYAANEDRPEVAFAFEAGTRGPLDAGESYELDVTVDPSTTPTRYRMVIDGRMVGNPASTLRPYVPRAGRHSVAVEVHRGDVVVLTDPIEVYAIGEVPGPGFRANLASLTAEPDNWASALARFDELVEAGHEGLELLPSDRFASLQPGFWNLFVPGFGSDRAGAVAYCQRFDLAIPNDCFASFFDPLAPATDPDA